MSSRRKNEATVELPRHLREICSRHGEYRGSAQIVILVLKSGLRLNAMVSHNESVYVVEGYLYAYTDYLPFTTEDIADVIVTNTPWWPGSLWED